MRACRLLRLAHHASTGHALTGHRVVQSFKPGETWFYDYETREMGDRPQLAPPTERPADQPAPGPRGRVPSDWLSKIHR